MKKNVGMNLHNFIIYTTRFNHETYIEYTEYKENKNFDVGFGLKGELNLVKKIISINKKKTSLRNFFNIFWVLPQMSHLLQGKPEDRRSFLDLMVAATDVSYKNKLLDY